MAFEKQEELLGILNEGWQQKIFEEHEEILKNHPFDDFAGLRAKFFQNSDRVNFHDLNIHPVTIDCL